MSRCVSPGPSSTSSQPDTAQTLAYAEIERLRPRDNSIDGKAVDYIDVALPENPPRDENEKRGRAAMRRVIRTRSDVLDAMDVPGLGAVSFIWGDRTGGIWHIVENPKGPRLRDAMRVPRTIARGTLGIVSRARGRARRNITYGSDVVVLQLNRDDRPHRWVVTAWRKK